MALNRGFLFAILVVVAAAELVGNAAAATYVVGDSLGWTVPPNGAADYSNWASQHVFRVGDVLGFNFTTGFHDVAHVNRAGFDGCSSNSPISLVTVGPANITLNSTGPAYYICTFGQHCTLGQRLAINVTAASTSPAPAPAPTTPAPTPTPTPSPSPSPTPSPSPSPSGAPSPSPSGAPSPGSTPSPTPSGSATPPPAPASESSPPGSSIPTGGLSPPPPPSSATIATLSAPLVVFASVALGVMI